jgi:hypothetical protein
MGIGAIIGIILVILLLIGFILYRNFIKKYEKIFKEM